MCTVTDGARENAEMGELGREEMGVIINRESGRPPRRAAAQRGDT